MSGLTPFNKQRCILQTTIIFWLENPWLSAEMDASHRSHFIHVKQNSASYINEITHTSMNDLRKFIHHKVIKS